MAGAPEDHFSPIAAEYSRGRFGYPPVLFDRITALCERRDTAWDCATGSGQAVPELARRFRHVIATDLSAELLKHAPQLPNVEYIVASAEHAPLPEHSVDLLTVAQALHWFDLPSFWAEAQRVVRPGGIFAYWGYLWPTVAPEVDAVIDKFRAAIAPYWPPRTALLHNAYAEVRPPFTFVEKIDLEMAVNWTRSSLVTHLGSWSAVRYYRERTGRDVLPTLEPALTNAWPYDEPRSMRWPLHLYVYRVV